MSPRQIFLILRARWQLIAGVLLVTLVAVAMVSFLLPKQYVASADVVVDVKATDPVAGAEMQAQYATSYLATQVETISSDRVTQRVIKILALDQNAGLHSDWQAETKGAMPFDGWLEQRILTRLHVSGSSSQSNVIRITVAWPSAKMAADLANAYAKAYIETSLALKVEPATQYASWFEERTTALRKDLEQAQQRLSDYQRAHGITASDEHLDVENLRLNDLSTQLVTVQGLRSESESRQRQASSSRDSLPEVLQSPLISGLTSDLAKLEAQREELSGRLGQNHPQIQQLDNQISSLRQRISLETNRVASSLDASNHANVEREAQAQSAFNAQRQRVLALKNARDEFNVLENDVQSAQRNLDLVSQHLAQSNLESQTQQTNVYVLNSAVPPGAPISPRPRMNILLGAILGALLGIGIALMLELANRRVRSARDLATIVGLPVLVVLSADRNIPRKRLSLPSPA